MENAMPSKTRSSSSTSRRFIWLAVTIVAVGVFWTLGWHLIAGRIETRLPESLRQIAGDGARAECANAEIRGYPFRFGLFCDRLTYRGGNTGIQAESGPLRSAAQFYRPNHVVSELDGPLAFSVPEGEGRVDWQGLQASVQATIGGLERGSLDSQNISMDIDTAGWPQKLGFSLERLTAHARKNGPDLDIAAYGNGLQSDFLLPMAARALIVEATLPDQAGILNAPFIGPSVPYDARLHRISIELDDAASIEISGPARVAADGLLSGDLNLTIRNHQRFAEIAAKYDPEIGKLINRFAPMLGALDTVPGDDAVTLPLTIRGGAVSIGFIPLGQLPPL
jgi:hypothetical protein